MTDPANAASREARARDAIKRLRHQVGDSLGPGGIGLSRSDGKVLLALADEAASQPRSSDYEQGYQDGLRMAALHDTAPTDQAQGGGEVERLQDVLERLIMLTPNRANAKDAQDLHCSVRAIAASALDASPGYNERPNLRDTEPASEAALAQSNPTDGGMAL